MSRVVLTAALALLVLWWGKCLEFRDGAIINRCGLWQLFTGDPMVLRLPQFRKAPPPVIVIGNPYAPSRGSMTPITLQPYAGITTMTLLPPYVSTCSSGTTITTSSTSSTATIVACWQGGR